VHAVRALLEGVPGPLAALLRAVYQHEPRSEWALWPVAIAAWIRARNTPDDHHHHDTDAVHDVLFHQAGGDPHRLSEARRTVSPEHAMAVREALVHHPDVATAILAVTLLLQTHDESLADGVLALHGGDVDADARTAALACVAGFHRPDAIPPLLRHPDPRKRTLGLICAEWVPTTDVLAALLEAPVPADAAVRLQYARSLASMADQAVIPHLQTLLRQDEHGGLGPVRALAEELLRMQLE
jgi:hypothetical protein